MSNINIEDIKKLRDMTGVGVNAVREALEKSEGNFDAAIAYLREKGMAKSAKRKGNMADNGFIAVYTHQNSRFVVVTQVSCETDFAANSDDLKKFANDIALHVAAVNPTYIEVDSVPGDVVDSEKKVFEAEVAGKPAEVKEKIMEGKLAKFFGENVLMEQKLFTDETKTVKDYLNELVAKLGEKIEVSYFYKFSIKDGINFTHLNTV